MKNLENIEQKLQQKTISFQGMKRIHEKVRDNPREINYPNERDPEKLIEIIQLYDKVANDFQDTWQEETTDEIELRLSMLKHPNQGKVIKAEGRVIRYPLEKNPYILADIVFQYHKAVNNPITLAIADAMVRIWQSQGFPTKGEIFRNNIEHLLSKYYD